MTLIPLHMAKYRQQGEEMNVGTDVGINVRTDIGINERLNLSYSSYEKRARCFILFLFSSINLIC